MRYKRYKKRYSRVLKMKFQSFVDISTEADTMKIISVNAGGPDILQRLAPFFNAYKYYKLGGVSFKMIPASTLPVDPLQLSYDSSDLDAVDPRDQLTPGMCRITNGEDILENITGLSGDAQRDLYNNMLLDPRWYKWMLQSGVKRYGKPRYWTIGQLHQDKYPGARMNYPYLDDSTNSLEGTVHQDVSFDDGAASLFEGKNVGTNPGSTAYGIFQTGHRGVLGWMPTDGLVQTVNASQGGYVTLPAIASPPEVELFKILMPPVRKTNYFYRCFITEIVYFREPIVLGLNSYRPIDVFHIGDFRSVYRPVMPTDNAYGGNGPGNEDTGGNYGNS